MGRQRSAPYAASRYRLRILRARPRARTATGTGSNRNGRSGLNSHSSKDRNGPEQQERRERQERVTDWATDNLDMVSASPAQIREVLTKDPGLMVELKRLMAKQAIEKGQIVAEQDLEDDAILDRLTTDIRFRALATRLLQRYGYLSPQLNPLSPSAREQDLLMRAKAERLARATPEETELGPGLRPSQAACEQDQGRTTPAA